MSHLSQSQECCCNSNAQKIFGEILNQFGNDIHRIMISSPKYKDKKDAQVQTNISINESIQKTQLDSRNDHRPTKDSN